MATTHIEVVSAGSIERIKTGQMLRVLRETPCFFVVCPHGEEDREIRVSKKTHKSVQCNGWRTKTSPATFNF
jgi:hypothetical protein